MATLELYDYRITELTPKQVKQANQVIRGNLGYCAGSKSVSIASGV